MDTQQDITKRRTQLSPEKQLLLQKRLQATSQVIEEPTIIIVRRPDDSDDPLSFVQERFWFLQQFDPNSGVYNEADAIEIHGQPDLAVFAQAIREIIRRHEILRTTLPIVDGFLKQIIHPIESLQNPFTVIDLQSLPVETRYAVGVQLVEQEMLRPFNLINDWPWRIYLIQIMPDHWILSLLFHHIVSDGWSMYNFHNELNTLYKAFLSQQPSPLAELPIQYADYACWQRQAMQNGHLKEQLEYWKQKLQGVSPILALPLDFPRLPVQTYNGQRKPLAIPQSLSMAVQSLSNREGATLFMTLFAILNILLFRYTAQEDIVIGSPIAGRTHPDLEQLIGMFVNTLVLRNDLSRNPTFCELLKRVRSTCLEAFVHQDVPFDHLVEFTNPERNLSHLPLVQMTFVLQNIPEGHANVFGLESYKLELDNPTARFDLTLRLQEAPQGLQGFLEYNTDLFTSATIDRLCQHFITILTSVVDHPQQHITDIPLLSASERQQLLVDWNATEASYPQKTIHTLFEAQVLQQPDTIAALFADSMVSYSCLNQSANQIAYLLRNYNVGPEVRVGICLDRSLDLITGLLGILKAGGVYVPLDPTYPQERLEWVVTNAHISIILTQSHLLGVLPAHAAQTICLDHEYLHIAQQPVENMEISINPHNLAYIIYTSGSTGKPKGVQIEHHTLTNFLYSMAEKPGLTQRDYLLSVTTLAFDIAALELFLPLMVGAHLMIVSREVAADGRQLIKHAMAYETTVLQATPATWRLLIEGQWNGMPQLRMLCGGEALPKALATQLLDRSPELWNMYGPTETTIWSAVQPVDLVDTTIRIGSPIANTSFYIVDTKFEPLPIGVYGELYIGGDVLARGYLSLPKLTAERFIPDPFSNMPGARMYRTGDVMRYHLDGTMEFSARADHQVKVRGYRIELGEIETVLLEHRTVQNAVVLVHVDQTEVQRLVAYVVPTSETTDTSSLISVLRHYLQQCLPDYMIPSVWMVLDTLPLTPNGKIDRKTLLHSTKVRPEPEHAFVAPQTTTEQKLADIWATILDVERVGVLDNFFDLGGHSILATRVIARVDACFQVELSLRSLFEHHTLQAAAAHIDLLCQGDVV